MTNALDQKFQGFNSGKNFSATISNPLFDLNVSSDTAFYPSDRNLVTVEIDADPEDLKDFTIQQKDNVVLVRQSGSSSSGSVVIGDGNVMSIGGGKYNMSGVQITGGNSSVRINGNLIETRGGKTYVNGVQIDGAGAGSPPRREPRIRIFAPPGSGLEAKLNGIATLASKVPFGDVEVEASGSSNVGFAAYSASLDLSGSGRAMIVLNGGDLDASVSGSGRIEVQGSWDDAKADISGMGSVSTSGTCRGNYKASVSGMGSVTHVGSVGGRVKKSVSGMGRINIPG